MYVVRMLNHEVASFLSVAAGLCCLQQNLSRITYILISIENFIYFYYESYDRAHEARLMF